MMRAICKSCKHLREASGSPELQEYYVSCGYPMPVLPVAWSVIGPPTEAQRMMPRKLVDELGHMRDKCPTYARLEVEP